MLVLGLGEVEDFPSSIRRTRAWCATGTNYWKNWGGDPAGVLTDTGRRMGPAAG